MPKDPATFTNLADQPCVQGTPSPIAQTPAGPTQTIPSASALPATSYYDRCLGEYVAPGGGTPPSPPPPPPPAPTVPQIVSHAINSGSAVQSQTVTLSTVPSGGAVYVGVVVGSAGPTDPTSVTDSAGNIYTKIATGLVGDSYSVSVWMVDDATGGSSVVITATVGVPQEITPMTGVSQDMCVQATAVDKQATPSLDPSSPVTCLVTANPISAALAAGVLGELMLLFVTVNAFPATYSGAGLGTVLDQIQAPSTDTSLCVVYLGVTDHASHTVGCDSSPAPTADGGGFLVGIEGNGS